MVTQLLNIIGVDLTVLPQTVPELLFVLIKIIVGLGIILWCFGLIKSWTINLFGGGYLK